MKAPFVMIVDDEVPFVETISKRLVKRNVKLLKAFTGEECLEALQAHQNLDVVVLDVKMPGMDGIEALKAIKDKYPMVEVVMLTGHGTIETAIQGMKLGAHDYMMKPCDIDDLVAKIVEATEKKRAKEEKIRAAQSEEFLSRYEP
ncbi:MAG: response regulator [Desulfobacterales bacterium]|nr:response regulator [Desulfobacterales bacterium]MCF8078699.1 response regulator [Desulfobacterales bacterium]